MIIMVYLGRAQLRRAEPSKAGRYIWVKRFTHSFTQAFFAPSKIAANYMNLIEKSGAR
jgi:hypothetical protein